MFRLIEFENFHKIESGYIKLNIINKLLIHTIGKTEHFTRSFKELIGTNSLKNTSMHDSNKLSKCYIKDLTPTDCKNITTLYFILCHNCTYFIYILHNTHTNAGANIHLHYT